MQVDYKAKYKELKAKVKELTDLSFRLGVEEGMRQGQVQQAQDQAAQAQQMAAAAQQPGQPGKPGFGKEGADPEADQNGENASAGQNGSELDQHINELESLLQKMEKDSEGYTELRKSIDGLTQMSNSKKAQAAIDGIAKALKKPFTLGTQAAKNMNAPAQNALGMQESLVNDIMKGWQDEEQRVLTEVTKTVAVEGLLKG